MQNLTEWKGYWEGMAAAVGGIDGALAVTLDENMGKKILGLPKGSTTLFYLPPSAHATGRNADNWGEDNDCVIFVMEKYDPQRRTAYDVLESSQPAIEAVKGKLVADMARGCPKMQIDISTLSTLPETQFYAGFAGWSLGFKINT